MLCRIYNKKGKIEKQPPHVQPPPPVPQSLGPAVTDSFMEHEDKKPPVLTGSATVPALPPPPLPQHSGPLNDLLHFEPSDSVPRLYTDSSCSEHVVTPELACEVQSEPRWKTPADWESVLGFSGGNYGISAAAPGFDLLHDMFMDLQKPF